VVGKSAEFDAKKERERKSFEVLEWPDGNELCRPRTSKPLANQHNPFLGLGAIQEATSQSGPQSSGSTSSRDRRALSATIRPIGNGGAADRHGWDSGDPRGSRAWNEDGAGRRRKGELRRGVFLTATAAGRREKDRRKMTQFLTLGGSYELTCPTADSQWIAGRLGLRAKDAGDCREQPSRHVSAKGANGGPSLASPSIHVEHWQCSRGLAEHHIPHSQSLGRARKKGVYAPVEVM
jgi:hypothetical protein